MTNTRRRLSWLALGATLALVGAACSSSSKSATSRGTSTSAGTAAPTTVSGGGSSGSSQAYLSIQGGTAADLRGKAGSGLTRGVTATDVTLGCIYQANFYAGLDTGIKARLNAANKAGGVNGRTIKVLPCQDDGGDGNTTLSETRQQVQQSNVFGMIYNTVGTLPATTDFLNGNEVPFVGWGTLPGWCGTRWGFGYNGCLAAGSAPGIVPTVYYNTALVDPAMKLAKVAPPDARAAIVGNDNAASKAGNAQFQTLFQQQGAKVVYNQANIPASGFVDYTPFVQAVTAANPNIVILDTTFGNIGGMSSGLVNAGYKGVIMNFVAYTPTLATTPDLAKALQGGYVNLQFEPQETGSSYIKQLQSDLQAIGAPTSITIGVAQGYEMANLWVQMLTAAGKDLNTKTLDDAVNNSGNFTSKSGHADGAGDIKWPSGHFIPVPCAAIVQINNGKYTTALPYSCYTVVAAK